MTKVPAKGKDNNCFLIRNEDNQKKLNDISSFFAYSYLNKIDELAEYLAKGTVKENKKEEKSDYTTYYWLKDGIKISISYSEGYEDENFNPYNGINEEISNFKRKSSFRIAK